MRLHHFGLPVANLEASIAWWTEKLDFALDYVYDIAELDARVAFLAGNGFRVELFELKDASPVPASEREVISGLHQPGLKHATIAVDDLRATMHDLQSRGVEFAGEPAIVPGSGEMFVFFRDLHGVLIELFEAKHSP